MSARCEVRGGEILPEIDSVAMRPAAVPELADLRAGGHDSEAVFEVPDGEPEAHIDIKVDVHENPFRTCTATIPQVAGGLGVARCPREHGCRAGLQADDRSDPSGAWYGHGDGRDVHGHPTLPWVLPPL